MNPKISKSIFIPYLFLLSITLVSNGCNETKKQKAADKTEDVALGPKAQDIIPFFQHWNLILGDGSNVGQASTTISFTRQLMTMAIGSSSKPQMQGIPMVLRTIQEPNWPN